MSTGTMSPFRSFYVDFDDAIRQSPMAFSLIAIAFTTLMYQLFSPPGSRHRPDSKTKEVQSSIFGGLGSPHFYSDQSKFLTCNLGHLGALHPIPGIRSNCVGNVFIVSSDNKADAKTFFNNRDANFGKGYQVMFAGMPELPIFLRRNDEFQSRKELEDFHREHLKAATSTERLSNLIPGMAKHATTTFARLPKEKGLIDTHVTIYRLIFQISVQTIGCIEHARSPEMLRRITDPFWVFQESARFGSTFFPLIPFPRTIRKWASSFRLYQEISHTVNERIVEGRRENDYVQEMIDQEATTGQIALHVVGALFAAIIDSTGVAAYFLIFVGTDEMCMSKLRDEMEGLLRQEAEKIDRSYDELDIIQRVASVPLESWEKKLPYMDACLKETLRKLMSMCLYRSYQPRQSAARRGLTLTYGGEQLRRDDILVYWLSLTHYSSEIYPDPHKFDPDRFFVHQQGAGDQEFLSWGTGLHPCAGMRFAKLEIKVVVASFLLAFDYKSVDPSHNNRPYTIENAPMPKKGDNHTRIPATPVRLMYSINRAAAARYQQVDEDP